MTQVPQPDRPDAPSTPVRGEPAQILDMFSRARPVPVAEAARDAAGGTVVKIAGRAVVGPGGPLRAPLSGAECVWYRSIVLRELRGSTLTGTRSVPLRPINALAPSDLPDYGASMRVDLHGNRIGSDVSSVPAFAIADTQPAGGDPLHSRQELLIEPRTTDIDSNVFAINERVYVGWDRPAIVIGNQELSASKFEPYEMHIEWIIPVGAPLLVVGSVVAGPTGPTLGSSGAQIALASTKPEQQILSRNTAAGQAHLPINSRRAVMIVLAMLLVAVVIAVIVVLGVVS